MTTAARKLLGAALTVLAGGIVLALAGAGDTAQTIGATLIGVATVLLLSFAFLVVGEGEDRDRARRPLG